MGIRSPLEGVWVWGVRGWGWGERELTVDVPFAGRHCGHSEYKTNATYHSETATMPLPDEMIAPICSKMNPMDVLYSFIGVNERLNRLARDRSLSVGYYPSTMFSSASIVRLHADVRTLDDFLYLLDGRLPRLQRLTIYIARIDHSDVVADAKVCRSLRVSIGKNFCDLVLEDSSKSEKLIIHFTSPSQIIR